MGIQLIQIHTQHLIMMMVLDLPFLLVFPMFSFLSNKFCLQKFLLFLLKIQCTMQLHTKNRNEKKKQKKITVLSDF